MILKNDILISVIMNCYNSSEFLREAIESVLAQTYQNWEIIFWDNVSTDNTQDVLRKVRKDFPTLRVAFEGKKGFGNALLKGFSVARGDVLGYIHGDNQMETIAVFKMYQRIVDNNLALCKATRLNRNDGIYRWIISKSYNLLFGVIFSIKMKDINGSPKLFTKDFFEEARLKSQDWFIDPEIVLRAHELGVKMSEYEIQTRPRKYGNSEVRVMTVFEFLKNMYHYYRKQLNCHLDSYATFCFLEHLRKLFKLKKFQTTIILPFI